MDKLELKNIAVEQGLDFDGVIELVFDEQQAKVEELQKQFDQHDKLLLQRNKDVQELYNINEKHAAEKAELQKRVDLALLGINGVMRWIDEDAIDDADFIRGGVLSALRRLEQALKGEG